MKLKRLATGQEHCNPLPPGNGIQRLHVRSAGFQSPSLDVMADRKHRYVSLMSCIRITVTCVCMLAFLPGTLVHGEVFLSCGVRQLDAINTPQAVFEQSNSQLNAPVDDGSWITSYHREISGEWIPTPGDDPKDKLIRIILWTPNGPIAVKIEVTIDGLPYRQQREKLINECSHDEASLFDAITPLKDISDDATTEIKVAKDQEVSPAFAKKAGLRQRLKNHFRNRELDPAEARWLLCEWIPGPALVRTKTHFAAERSRLSPIFAALDRDQDGELDQGELKQTQSNLMALDEDENEVIEQSELAKATNDAIWYPAELLTIFGQASSAPINEAQFGSLPLIELRASFGSREDQRRLELLSVDPRITKEKERAQSLFATDDALVVERPRYRIEVVASQVSDYRDFHGQVSVGAVVDGLPLWRELDADNSGRLERDERVRLASIWKRSDQNRDGKITASELRSPIRLAIGCGPCVHKELAKPCLAISRTHTKTNPLPDWFVSMDLNEDGEISRTEFIGTDEQFAKMDVDGNDIIGTNETAIENE